MHPSHDPWLAATMTCPRTKTSSQKEGDPWRFWKPSTNQVDSSSCAFPSTAPGSSSSPNVIAMPLPPRGFSPGMPPFSPLPSGCTPSASTSSPLPPLCGLPPPAIGFTDCLMFVGSPDQLSRIASGLSLSAVLPRSGATPMAPVSSCASFASPPLCGTSAAAAANAQSEAPDDIYTRHYTAKDCASECDKDAAGDAVMGRGCDPAAGAAASDTGSVSCVPTVAATEAPTDAPEVAPTGAPMEAPTVTLRKLGWSHL